MTDNFLTTTQAAAILGLTRIRVIQYCKAGRLGQKVGSRYIISVDELAVFAKIPRKSGNPNFKKGKRNGNE